MSTHSPLPQDLSGTTGSSKPKPFLGNKTSVAHSSFTLPWEGDKSLTRKAGRIKWKPMVSERGYRKNFQITHEVGRLNM
jgi:hypothetical protein